MGSLFNLGGGGLELRYWFYAIFFLGIFAIVVSAEDQPFSLSAKPVAHLTFDEVAFIVHKSNPIKNLSRQEILDIYSGKVRTWKEVRGQDNFIWVVNEDEGRAAFGVFKQYFKFTGKFLKNAVIIGPNKQTIQSVAGNPHAIGYVTLGAAMMAEAKGVKIKRLILAGVEGPAVIARN